MSDMYKNQLQELAQRSCFNLPSYACIREGPDHAPRFKASVNFNGEIFESQSYCPTLRQAEHAAAEVALNVLSSRGPSRSLTARVLDETGIYKNLLQETAHRAGLNLPVYTTVRSGPGHVPIFTCTVELAGMNFTGESAKTKKQAEKNAAIAAWSALKRMPNLDSLTNKEGDNHEEQDQAAVARVLSCFKPKDENKQVRRRDHHNQARRRMVKNGPSTSSNALLHQQWRLMDLLMDPAMDGSTQRQNSFVSLLPPPPPRRASKILPPTTSETKIQNIPSPPVEEHLKNEGECSNTRNSVSSNSVYGANSNSLFKPGPVLKSDPIQISSVSRLFGSLSPAALKATAAPQIGRNMYTGGFNPHRIAPAVQIRSVIPVCAAAPPPNPLRPQPATSSMKDASPSSPSLIVPSPPSLSTQTGAEVSSASSKLKQSQAQPTELSSELIKLQL
ncbi:hypothetical protein SLA2020_022100 [Shorea laevis]